MSDVVAAAAPRFELSREDRRAQARAAGFWRGLSVGFVSAFFLFEGALRLSAAVETVTSFTATNLPAVLSWGAAAVTLALVPVLLRALGAERARREKLDRLRRRLCG